MSNRDGNDDHASSMTDGTTSQQLRELNDAAVVSRRGVLWRTGLATVAGVAALSALDDRRAEAATGGNFLLGNNNDANATTELHATSASATSPLMKLNGAAMNATATTLLVVGPPGGAATSLTGSSTGSTTGLALNAAGSGSAVGIYGSSGSGSAVIGTSTSGPGVTGNSTSGTGVAGNSSSGDAVVGTATGNGRNGVIGSDTSPAGGTGVAGTSTHGVAVRATSSGGTALSVDGKTHFSRSGTDSIAAGSKTHTVSVSGMTSSSRVLVTLQKAASGVYLSGATPASGAFTVHLNKAPSAKMPFAWFVVSG